MSEYQGRSPNLNATNTYSRAKPYSEHTRIHQCHKNSREIQAEIFPRQEELWKGRFLVSIILPRHNRTSNPDVLKKYVEVDA